MGEDAKPKCKDMGQKTLTPRTKRSGDGWEVFRVEVWSRLEFMALGPQQHGGV